MAQAIETVRAGLARVQDAVAIYDGEQLIGWTIAHRNGIDAVAASGRALGRFNTDHAALGALIGERR